MTISIQKSKVGSKHKMLVTIKTHTKLNGKQTYKFSHL